MQWAIGEAHKSIGPKGELLEVKEVQGIGQTAIVDGEQKIIGAGGVGKGVKLALSDKGDQERSKKMLGKMLRENRRRKKKRDEERELGKKGAMNQDWLASWIFMAALYVLKWILDILRKRW